MKKKILTLTLCVAMLATVAVSGTLAYFTDTDNETNVFVTGKLDIDLKETFEQKSKLLPGKENAVQKEVWIELEDGSEDAYVWYTYAIPAALDSTDGSTGLNNIVHVNGFGYTWDTYRENSQYWPEGQTVALPLEQTWDHDPDVELGEEYAGPQGLIETYTDEETGIKYNVYLVLYHGVMSHEEGGQTKTSTAMSQVYMDAGVDATTNADGSVTYTNKNGDTINYDFSKNISIPVKAYGIQAEGLTDADGDSDVDVYDAYILYNAD